MNGEFNEMEFNQGEMNNLAPDATYVLYLWSGGVWVQIAEGEESEVPVELVMAGHRYRMVVTDADGTHTTEFNTPPNSHYDGMSG